ncbi:hypothetical protein [Bacillus pinisoli]|uniref:hypothetical protein n=1 Tax=Bacillus pinisoli TaxID=2901866 RepID=UPI001FF33C89|nr:hypothetical protein [Bacillus pinisoli]
MAIRHVTKKRTGKATKRKKVNEVKTVAIRIMRAAFFLLIGIMIFFFYFLYENGKLIDYMTSSRIPELFSSGILAVLSEPIIIMFFLMFSIVFLWIGYQLGKKRA